MEQTTAKPPCVLIYGLHRVLLESRAALLKLSGLKVSFVMTEAAAEDILATTPIDLTILCHTLSEEERDYFLAAAHRLKPLGKTLLLVHNESLEIAIKPTGIFLVSKGPQALLLAVNHILGRQSAAF